MIFSFKIKGLQAKKAIIGYIVTEIRVSQRSLTGFYAILYYVYIFLSNIEVK